jgi:cystathionine gamma-synthase
MSSIYSALLSSRRTLGPEKASIVFGFPYLDTLKLCSRKEFCKGGVEFFGHTNAKDLDELEQVLEKKQVCALFTEVPSNPLLKCPDLERLRSIADKHNVCLVVDDTIGNFLNVSLLKTGLADVVCTSLTKLFSGRGDVMAGSLIANPYTDMGRAIQQDLTVYQEKSLFDADAWALWHNSRSFAKRNARINETASQLADYLQTHNDVDRVYYPKYSSHYPSSHFGGLFSLLLGSHICQRTFYDALNVAKGPSLGTNFTLVCPYTLLAHYHELDFAMSYGVKPNLLRISVGLEPLEELREKFSSALAASRLHPKIGQRRAYTTMTCRKGNLRVVLKMCMRGRGVAL